MTLPRSVREPRLSVWNRTKGQLPRRQVQLREIASPPFPPHAGGPPPRPDTVRGQNPLACSLRVLQLKT